MAAQKRFPRVPDPGWPVSSAVKLPYVVLGVLRVVLPSPSDDATGTGEQTLWSVVFIKLCAESVRDPLET